MARLILLKNRCFWLGNVMIPMPDGVYLNADRSVLLDVGIDWEDIQEKYRVAFLLLREEYDAEQAIWMFYKETTQGHSEVPQKIRLGALSGYLALYTSKDEAYCEAEMAFDVGCAAEHRTARWRRAVEGDQAVLHVSALMRDRDSLVRQLQNGALRRLLESVRVKQS